MTREKYFEVCESLGSTPVEEEIPIELHDLPILVQQAFMLYSILPDEWEYMGGNYVGKRLDNVFTLCELHNIVGEEALLMYKIISTIDSKRRKLSTNKK